MGQGKPSVRLIAALIVMLPISLVALQYAYLQMSKLGIALRKALTGLLFAKSLHLSSSSVLEASSGKLINICSGDMAIIESNGLALTGVLSGVISTLAIIALLYQAIGMAAFYSLGISLSLFLV